MTATMGRFAAARCCPCAVTCEREAACSGLCPTRCRPLAGATLKTASLADLEAATDIPPVTERPTPRTDAAIIPGEHDDLGLIECVPAKLARELERELDAASKLANIWQSAFAESADIPPVGARPTSTIEDALLEDCDRQRQKIHVMGEALKRSLDWLASYPGGGALNAWQQARAALSFVPPDLPLDVPPKIQCPDLLGLIGHLRYYASVDVRRGPNDSAWVTLMATVDKVLADRQPKVGDPQ